MPLNFARITLAALAAISMLSPSVPTARAEDILGLATRYTTSRIPGLVVDFDGTSDGYLIKVGDPYEVPVLGCKAEPGDVLAVFTSTGGNAFKVDNYFYANGGGGCVLELRSAGDDAVVMPTSDGFIVDYVSGPESDQVFTRAGGAGSLPGGKRDSTPPTLTTPRATGKFGAKVNITYTVADDSGQSREAISVFHGTAVLAVIEVPLGARASNTVSFKAPKQGVGKGAYFYTVISIDAAGNASQVSQGQIKLSVPAKKPVKKPVKKPAKGSNGKRTENRK